MDSDDQYENCSDDSDTYYGEVEARLYAEIHFDDSQINPQPAVDIQSRVRNSLETTDLCHKGIKYSENITCNNTQNTIKDAAPGPRIQEKDKRQTKKAKECNVNNKRKQKDQINSQPQKKFCSPYMQALVCNLNVSVDKDTINRPQEAINRNYNPRTVALNPYNRSILAKQLNENNMPGNESENSNSRKSRLLEISTDSSESSDELNSKYCIQDKNDKLKKRQRSTSESSTTSNTNESIFEVPIPPKPAPEVIEVEDSESDSDLDIISESSSDDSIEDITINPPSPLIQLGTVNTSSKSNEIVESEIILNVAPIDKCVSDLDELRVITHGVRENTPELQNANDNFQDPKTYDKNSKHSTEDKNKNLDKTEIPRTYNPSKKTDNINSKIRSNMSLEEYFFEPMPAKIKAFYNDSWGGETFDMKELQNYMPKNPNKWVILNEDRVKSRCKRYFGIRCSRCNQEGHKLYQCKEPIKISQCHMCGIKGHHENNCPKKQCLTCGIKNIMFRKTCSNCETFFCRRCSSRGHSHVSCPDLWRRYHHTTEINDIQLPQNSSLVMKSKENLSCCNCAKKGHDSMQCKKLRWSQHYPNPSYVANYHENPTYPVNKKKHSPKSSEITKPTFNNNNQSSELNYKEKICISGKDLLESNQNNCTINNSRKNSFEEIQKSKNSMDVLLSKSNLNDESRDEIVNTTDMNISKIDNAQSNQINEITNEDVNSEGLNTENETRVRFISRSICIQDFDDIDNITIFNFKTHNPALISQIPPLSGFMLSDFSKEELSKCLFSSSLLKFLRYICVMRPLQFVLKKLSGNFILQISAHGKGLEKMKRLVEQHLDRSSYEKDLMFYPTKKITSKDLCSKLSTKIDQLKSNHDDPVELYETIITLKALNNPDKKRIDNLQEKMLMALYKADCGDDSFQVLSKRTTSIKLRIKKSKNEERNFLSCCHSYIVYVDTFYYYNNVFVAHMPKNISKWIQKYKSKETSNIGKQGTESCNVNSTSNPDSQITNNCLPKENIHNLNVQDSATRKNLPEINMDDAATKINLLNTNNKSTEINFPKENESIVNKDILDTAACQFDHNNGSINEKEIVSEKVIDNEIPCNNATNKNDSFCKKIISEDVSFQDYASVDNVIIFDIKTTALHLASDIPSLSSNILTVLPERDLLNCTFTEQFKRFLQFTTSRGPFQFLFQKIAGKFVLQVAAKKSTERKFFKLVKQHLQRSKDEKVFMYYPTNTLQDVVYSDLTRKIAQLNSSLDDPSGMYKKIFELQSSCIQTKDKLDRCNNLQEKMLMALYKGGCADESLTELSRILKRIAISRKRASTKRETETHISVNKYLELIYFYNNVFVAHMPKNISKWIKEYEAKKRSEIRSNKQIDETQISNNFVFMPHNQGVPPMYHLSPQIANFSDNGVSVQPPGQNTIFMNNMHNSSLMNMNYIHNNVNSQIPPDFMQNNIPPSTPNSNYPQKPNYHHHYIDTSHNLDSNIVKQSYINPFCTQFQGQPSRPMFIQNNLSNNQQMINTNHIGNNITLNQPAYNVDTNSPSMKKNRNADKNPRGHTVFKKPKSLKQSTFNVHQVLKPKDFKLKKVSNMAGQELRVKKIIKQARALQTSRLKSKITSLNDKLKNKALITGREVFNLLAATKEIEWNNDNKKEKS